jgi:hypothetical protein
MRFLVEKCRISDCQRSREGLREHHVSRVMDGVVRAQVKYRPHHRRKRIPVDPERAE